MEYARLHFTTEERLMAEADYAQLDAHLQLHHTLSEQTAIPSKSRIQPETTQETLRFLKDWWLTHINCKDGQYTPAVHRHLGL